MRADTVETSQQHCSLSFPKRNFQCTFSFANDSILYQLVRDQEVWNARHKLHICSHEFHPPQPRWTSYRSNTKHDTHIPISINRPINYSDSRSWSNKFKGYKTQKIHSVVQHILHNCVTFYFCKKLPVQRISHLVLLSFFQTLSWCTTFLVVEL